MFHQDLTPMTVVMGGSGGQTIVGVISTSTHGGDLGIPPLPDMVRAIYLIGPGGKEWWIEPTGQEVTQIIDAAALAESVPCVAGRIVFNHDIFNSVLVACGRMGIIYSIVIEVSSIFGRCKSKGLGTSFARAASLTHNESLRRTTSCKS